MAASTLDRFRDALAALDVGWHRTAPADATAALADLVEPPAVGVPVPGVSLPDPVDVDPTPAALSAARTGVTPAAFGVADYGTVALPGTADGVEPVSLYPERHVAVVRERDVLPDVAAAFDRLGPRLDGDRESVVLATGPSATADMGALVTGVHGPGEVDVLVVGEQS
jgi:L-lactate dehydrogenase complex protein LldG